MTTFPVQGGCHCNAVRYTLLAPALSVQHCHCSRCRKSSGQLSKSGAVIQRADLIISRAITPRLVSAANFARPVVVFYSTMRRVSRSSCISHPLHSMAASTPGIPTTRSRMSISDRGQNGTGWGRASPGTRPTARTRSSLNFSAKKRRVPANRVRVSEQPVRIFSGVR